MSEKFSTRDLVFAQVPSGDLTGTLYAPVGQPMQALVLQVHGGGWCTGDRAQDSGFCAQLAEQGIAVFAIDFRMPPEAKFPAAAQDVATACAWLKGQDLNRGAPNDRIGLVGMSSGGHLAALVALTPEGVDGRESCSYWIGCWPVVDPQGRYHLAKARGREDLIRNHHAFWRDEGEMAEGSPQAIVQNRRGRPLPPALLIQGLEDENLDPEMTRRFARAYADAGGQVELLTFAGEPHAFMKRHPDSAHSRQALQAIVDFIRTQSR
jgi:acetyl esterase/lipase